MAKVFIEETTLTAIGDAIRGKDGTTDPILTEDMATRITDLPSGGGGNEPTDEELVLTGICDNRFANDAWRWVIDRYGDRITTNNITRAEYMFSNCSFEEIPFQLNINTDKLYYTFNNCFNLRVVPKIRGTIQWTTSTSLQYCFGSCPMLRDIEDAFTPEMMDGLSTVYVTSLWSVPVCCTVAGMYSLRRIPTWFKHFQYNPESTDLGYVSYTLYYQMAAQCYAVDDITDIPVWVAWNPPNDDMFWNAFANCSRAQNITFQTNEDGSPKIANWKNQTIDLTNNVGSVGSSGNILYYNSGITADKEVTDDTTYQELKNDPDWFTTNIAYSRYNHDSAVATINSLPDTSAAGGGNTLKLNGAAGSLTDGGAINTLTEEEIAVATAKGWTVTFA